MNKRNRYILEVLTSPYKKGVRHLLLQFLILAITSSVLWSTGSDALPDRNLLIVWLLYYAVVNLLVYLNIYILARKLLLHNRISAYVISVLGLVVVFILLMGVLQSLLPDDPGAMRATPAALGIISSVAAVGLLFAGTTALVLFRQWVLSGQKRRELESLNLMAELQMLKNQINPHFLFNMLNNCYLLVKKGRKEAPEVLFRMEELLRYQMGSVSNEKVNLKEEIRFLRDLLELEKIRRDKFRFSVLDNTGEGTLFLSPMILIPFVENAIKHNSDSENLSYVDLIFERMESGLIFTCKNSKPVTASAPKESGGLGLKNIGRRLELLFPERHKLTVSEDEATYSVTLKLEL